MKIALSQINPTVGDTDGNSSRIIDSIKKASREGADLVVFPEMSLLGYPPRDLLYLPDFIKSQGRALVLVAKAASDITAIVGGVYQDASGRLFNGAYALNRGRITKFIGKKLLPSYDVFDETRYFEPFAGPQVWRFKGLKVGLTVCEDLWNVAAFTTRHYPCDPINDLKRAGIDLLINISASPYEMGKESRRLKLLKTQSKRVGVPIVYVNQVGGNDELVFDGGSMIVDGRGRVLARAKSFEEDSLVWDWGSKHVSTKGLQAVHALDSVEKALILGIKDYIRKCGFTKVALGLSGGIDSALVAHLAVKALGPANVLGLLMPSCYTSEASNEDASLLAQNLRIPIRTIPIDGIRKAYEDEFQKMFKGLPPDTTEENIQARIRGNLLMAVSNKEGHLVLSTGNKSELSVGYCTLYGDMAGGLAVIADLPKTLVYELARHMNRAVPVIPERVFTKAPTAELKPGQTDQDTLPPYDVLDRILKFMIEDHLSDAQITKKVGADQSDTVTRIRRMVCRNEYKRRQAAPGLKITTRAFGAGRRFPIAARY